MSTTVPGLSLIVLIPAVLLLVGLVLTIWALVPRRRGSEPLCRRCEYNLTGHTDATEPRCPECGANLTPLRATVHGRRYRRWGWATMGIIVFLLGLGPLVAEMVGGVSRYDWYRIMPTSWVVSDATDPNSGRLSRAWVELKRRYEAGDLSAAQTDMLAARCLDEMARPTVRDAALSRSNEILKLFIQDDVLTGAQWQRLYENFATFEFEVRPRVVAGDQVPIRIVKRGRCPSGVLRYRVTTNSLRVGDREPHRLGGSSAGSVSYGGLGWSGTSVRLDEPPGLYPVACDVDIEVYAYPSWPGDEGARPVHVENRTFRGEIEVLATKPPDLIRMRHSPALDEYYASVTLSSVYARPRRQINHNEDVVEAAGADLHITVTFEPHCPLDAAFEIWLPSGGQLTNVGSVTHVARPTQVSRHHMGVHARLDTPVRGPVNILLRGSEDVARNTTDIFEIWDGEIIFERVEVAPDSASVNYGDSYAGTVRRRTPDELMPVEE